MPNDIETIYQDIAAYIVQSIPDDWSTAWITVEVTDENVYTLRGGYRRQSDMQDESFRVDYKVARLFSKIQSLIKRDDSEGWIRAKFTLESDGEFELEFTY